MEGWQFTQNPLLQKQTSANGCFRFFLRQTDFSLLIYICMCTVVPKRWRNPFSPPWNSFLVSSRHSTIFLPSPFYPCVQIWKLGNRKIIVSIKWPAFLKPSKGQHTHCLFNPHINLPEPVLQLPSPLFM